MNSVRASEQLVRAAVGRATLLRDDVTKMTALDEAHTVLPWAAVLEACDSGGAEG